MPFVYDVIILMDVEFAGGEARGTGGITPNFAKTGGMQYGGAGLEVQHVQITCQAPCAKKTICKRALTLARQEVVRYAVKYQWAAQGMRVITRDCRLIQETQT